MKFYLCFDLRQNFSDFHSQGSSFSLFKVWVCLSSTMKVWRTLLKAASDHVIIGSPSLLSMKVEVDIFLHKSLLSFRAPISSSWLIHLCLRFSVIFSALSFASSLRCHFPVIVSWLWSKQILHLVLYTIKYPTTFRRFKTNQIFACGCWPLSRFSRRVWAPGKKETLLSCHSLA